MDNSFSAVSFIVFDEDMRVERYNIMDIFAETFVNDDAMSSMDDETQSP